jgi:hypothetical protein
MKAKLDRLERDVAHMERHFVPIDLFHATIEPLRDNVREIQRDIKTILGWLTRHEKSERDD